MQQIISAHYVGIPYNAWVTNPVPDPITTNPGSYAGIFTYGNGDNPQNHQPFDPANSDHYREYLFQKFENPLEAGKIYKMKAKVRLADMSAVATGLGVMFSNDYVCTNNITSASISPNQFLEKTTSSLPGLTNPNVWTDFVICFQAEENWDWMTFGNFRNDDIGNFVHLNNNIMFGNNPELWESMGYHSYYFLDEFSLKPFSGGAGEDRDLACGFSTLLGDEVCGSETVTYSWSPSTGLSCTTCPRPTATVTSNTTYTLTVTDVETGCQLTDQVTVTVVPCCVGHNYQTAVDYTIVPGYGDHSEDWGAGIGAAGWNISNPTQSGYNRLAINATFTVDANDNFTFADIQILMGTDASIIVEAGATLTIDHCWLHACQRMWEGIFVQPGGKLIINGGSLIEDAKTAVVTVFPVNDALDIGQSIFNKNYVSVVVAASSTGINPASIIDNYFLCQTTLSLLGAPNYSLNLLDPHTQETRSYADIITWNVNDISIGGATDRNYFDNGYYGIYSLFSNVQSVNNEFHNFNPPVWCNTLPCYLNYGKCIYAATGKTNNHTLEVTADNEFYDSNFGVHSNNNMHLIADANYFENVRTGIHASLSLAPNRNIDISNNNMVDMETGIYCYDNKNADIDIISNTIASDVIGGIGIRVFESMSLVPTSVLIDDNDIDEVQKGIWTYNSNQDIIRNNDIKVADNSSGVFAGILAERTTGSLIYSNYAESTTGDLWKSGIRASTGANNWVFCNTAFDIGVGLQFIGAMQPSKVFKNRMENDNRGMVLNGQVGNIGLPGSPNVAWDNTWVGSYTTGNPHIFSVANNIQNRVYWSTANPIYNPSTWGESVLNFHIIPQFTNTNIQSLDICPEGVGTDDVVGPGDEKNMVIKALDDNSTQPYFTNELKWITRMGVYEMLIEDATLRTSHVKLNNFYDSCFAANIGKLMRLNNAFEDAQTNFAGGDGDDYMDTLDNITTSITPEDALRDVLKIALEKQLDNSTQTDSIEYRMTSVFLNMFPDSTFFVDEFKDMTYSSGQLSILESIAAECPFEYGPAVFMARAMLSLGDTIPYPYHNECELYGSGSSKWDNEITGETQESYDRTIRIYPNPANNNLTVELNFEEGHAYIEFWSITGSKAQTFSLKSGKTELDINKLNEGIYFYNIFINDFKLKNGKQIIIK